MSDISEFEELLIPLEVMISTVFTEHVKYQLIKLYQDHRHDVLISNAAMSTQEELISSNVKVILLQLSKTYTKKLLSFYSNDGLLLYIISSLKKLIYSELSSRLENDTTNKTSSRLTLTD